MERLWIPPSLPILGGWCKPLLGSSLADPCFLCCHVVASRCQPCLPTTCLWKCPGRMLPSLRHYCVFGSHHPLTWSSLQTTGRKQNRNGGMDCTVRGN